MRSSIATIRNVWKLRLAMRSRVIGFGLSAASPGGDAIWPDASALFFDINGRRGRIDLAQFKLPGRHNLANAMAAAAAALAIGSNRLRSKQASRASNP